MIFHHTTHLSTIIEQSEKNPVVIFKFSSNCNSSTRLKEQFEENLKEKKISHPVFLVTVQNEINLSRKIAEWFGIKHESPQVFLIDKGRVIYTDHHSAIDLAKLS